MVWGDAPVYGHFGLDLTGPNSGQVRIEAIRIEDVTSVFHRKLMDWVDVLDFGAMGDGVTDDRAAFLAAEEGAPVNHLHIANAARNEFRKSEKPCPENELRALTLTP